METESANKSCQAMHFEGWNLIPSGWFNTTFEDVNYTHFAQYEEFQTCALKDGT